MMHQIQRHVFSLTFMAIFVVVMVFFLWSGGDLFIFTNDAAELVQKGNYYFNVGGAGKYDLEKAEKYFNKALEINSNVPDAWHQLARIDFLRGDFRSALTKINKQIEIHGDGLMSSYYIRGLIYGYTKEYEKAEVDFLKFFEWDRNNWAVYNDLAWVYFQQGEYEKTQRTAEGGLAYFPNNPWLLNMAGLARMNLGDRKEARVYFKRALWFAEAFTELDWHKAYPGNDPSAAGQGISEMRQAIKTNLALVGDK